MVLFPGLPRWAGARRNPLDFYGAREDNRGRNTNHPASRQSNQTNQRPTSAIPDFYAGCSSCQNPATLSWLGTGTKYVGLHNQWRGYHQSILKNYISWIHIRLMLRVTKWHLPLLSHLPMCCSCRWLQVRKFVVWEVVDPLKVICNDFWLLK